MLKYLKNISFAMPKDEDSLLVAIRQLLITVYLITLLGAFLLWSDTDFVYPYTSYKTFILGQLLIVFWIYMIFATKSRFFVVLWLVFLVLVLVFDPTSSYEELYDDEDEHLLWAVDIIISNGIRLLLSIKAAYLLFVYQQKYARKQKLTKTLSNLVILIVGSFLILYISIKVEDDSKIRKALSGLDIKSYSLVEKRSKDDVYDYYIRGTLRSGSSFEAYVQKSFLHEGAQYRTNGYANCSGTFHNPKLDFCAR